MAAERLSGGLGSGEVGVADGYEFDVVDLRDVAEVHLSDGAGADDDESDFFHGSCLVRSRTLSCGLPAAIWLQGLGDKLTSFLLRFGSVIKMESMTVAGACWRVQASQFTTLCVGLWH